MKIKTKLWALLGTVLITGCQNTVNTVENADKTMTPNTIQDMRFVTDGFLKDRLALKGVNVSRTQDGFMRVQLEAVNVRTGAFAQMWSWLKEDSPYKVMYKFDWFDANGMQVKGIFSDWKTISVHPGESVFFQGIAPILSCKDFKISIRENK